MMGQIIEFLLMEDNTPPYKVNTKAVDVLATHGIRASVDELLT